jgi:hypothetical protein
LGVLFKTHSTGDPLGIKKTPKKRTFYRTNSYQNNQQQDKSIQKQGI